MDEQGVSLRVRGNAYNGAMTGMFALAVIWGGLLWYIAVTPKIKMQMVWLVLVGIAFMGPVLAAFWPNLR